MKIRFYLAVASILTAFSTSVHAGSGSPQNMQLGEGPDTVREMTSTFGSLGYNLMGVLSGKEAVPRYTLPSIPSDIGSLKDPSLRKVLFLQLLLPVILEVNREIALHRDRLIAIRNARDSGQKISPSDRAFIDMLRKRYDVESVKLKTLLLHVDVIPPSLALAQSALETGWGTSRFAHEANAMFGQWTWNGNGIVPESRPHGKKYKIAAYSSLTDSARSYINNLNSHAAYDKLRRERQEARRRGEKPSGYELVHNLEAYAQDPSYVERLQNIIDYNGLAVFDCIDAAADRWKITPDICS